MTMGVVVDTELGFDIQCDTSGTFSASVYGVFYQDKSITKVRKWVNAQAPAIRAIKVSGGMYRGHKSLEIIHVASVTNDKEGNPIAQKPRDNQRYSYKYGETAYVYNDGIVRAAEKLIDECAKRNRATNEWYEEKVNEIVTQLELLTPERFKELVEEARAEHHD